MAKITPVLRARPLAFLLLLLFVFLPALAQDDSPDKLKEKPITTAPGKVGDLLRQWWKEGTAAGNVGDIYDNRDRAHSDLDTGPYPQLTRYVYSEADLKVRKDWAGQRQLMPGVVFGNSSTSAPPTQGGSNVRMYYVSPAGLAFLYKQYTNNNVYIYPEHRDHDPGHNGRGDGFGDLYPTNTPFLFTSQGSSGSDQPFMRAIPFTLAAFRPEVKKKLAETGLLMPTLQMIFRSTYIDPAIRNKKPGPDPKDYLTGKAHPSVFEGAWVDDLAMVQMAHDIRLDNLPPMVQLRVPSEDLAIPGQDFFDVSNSEELATTPVVIARLVRGKNFTRTIRVSAEGSYDLNKKPLTFTWAILRGDPKRIKITPRNKEQSSVDIEVSYHERRPISQGAAMESNRVDIGVFVHNGSYYSAPGFVTFYSLDSEARAYNKKGDVLEIGYGLGETNFEVTNWNAFLDHATGDGLPAKLLNLKAEDRQSLQKALELHAKLYETLVAQREKTKTAEASRNLAVKEEKLATESKDQAILAKKIEARKQAETLLQAAQKDQEAANRAVNDLLDGRTKEVSISIRGLADKHLHQVAQDPNLFENPLFLESLQRIEPARLAAVQAARKRLVSFGLAEKEIGTKLALTPLRPGIAGSPPQWTAYEKAQIERFNASFLSIMIFPGSVNASYQVNFVDQRLTAPREWRDVYYYDAKGQCLGWTRFDGKVMHDFTADGLLVTKKDVLGRPAEARGVRYVQDATKSFGLNSNPLRFVPGDTVTIEYDGPEDRHGKVKNVEAK